MALFSTNATFEFLNRHRGWLNETVRVLSLACRGFESYGNFFIFALALIPEFST